MMARSARIAASESRKSQKPLRAFYFIAMEAGSPRQEKMPKIGNIARATSRG
jgi:hypothetical protein